MAEGEGFGLSSGIENMQLIENPGRSTRHNLAIRGQLERNWNTLFRGGLATAPIRTQFRFMNVLMYRMISAP